MAHEHNVYNEKLYFSIDPASRKIFSHFDEKVVFIQNDHNSERIAFGMPRYVEGHDMSLCSRAEVHYINVDMKTKEKNAGLYKVTDVAVNAEDENIVNFSWLISQNATKLVGTLNFLIRFICVDDEENVEYAWHTAICTEPVVLEGMCNTENIVEQYADILGQWREELLSTKSTGSWNDLTDKPFYDNTVKSSYSFETLPSVSFEASDYTWYKISDLTPSAEELLTTEISHDFGEGVTVRRPQESEFLVQDESCSAFQFSTTPTFGFFIAYITGAIETELGTANVPETGIYFGYATGETPPADLIIEVAYHDIKPLDEKYLPEDAIITIIDAYMEEALGGDY